MADWENLGGFFRGEDEQSVGGGMVGANNLRSVVDSLTRTLRNLEQPLSRINTLFQGIWYGGSSTQGSGQPITSQGMGGGKPNGGGATFGSGAYANTLIPQGGYQGGGVPPASNWTGRQNGGNGAGQGLGAVALTAANGYADRKMADFGAIDLLAKRYGTQGAGLSAIQADRLIAGQSYYGQSAADAYGSIASTIRGSGVALGSAGYTRLQGSVSAMSFGNADMAAGDLAGLQVGNYSVDRYLALRRLGIQSNVRGTRQSALSVMNQMAGRTIAGWGTRKMSSETAAATFSTTSYLAQNMRSAGYSEDEIQQQLTMLQQQQEAVNKGMNPQEYWRLRQSAAGGNKDATNQLKKLGFAEDMTTDMQIRQGALRKRDAEVVEGFSEGMEQAVKSVNLFTDAITAFLRETGLGKAGGFAAGATNVVSSAIGGWAGGMGIYGALKAGGVVNSLTGGGGVSGAAGRAAGVARSAGGRLGGVAGTLGKFAGPVAIAGAAKWAWDWRPWGDKAHEKSANTKTIWERFGWMGGDDDRGGAGGTGGTSGTGAGYASGDLRDPNAAIGYAQGETAPGGRNYYQLCDRFVANAYGLARSGYASARAHWAAIPSRYKHRGDRNPPKGALVFWEVGQYGHVALGVGGGKVASNDILKRGDISIVDLGLFEQKWRARYLGWTDPYFHGKIINLDHGATGGGGVLGAVTGDTAALGQSAATAASLIGGNSESAIVAARMGNNTYSGGSSATSGMAGAGSSASGASAFKPVAGALSPSVLKGILQQAGFSGNALNTAMAIARAESGWRPSAHNGNASTGDNSYGLFQINMLGAMGPDRRKKYNLSSNDDLFNPLINARIAYEMSRGGKNWGPWSSYKSGAYRKYMASYEVGAWEIERDQNARIHAGEMVLDRRSAETVRNALLRENVPSKANHAPQSSVTLEFGKGSVVIHVAGAPTEEAMRTAARQFAEHTENALRLKRLQEGY